MRRDPRAPALTHKPRDMEKNPLFVVIFFIVHVATFLGLIAYTIDTFQCRMHHNYAACGVSQTLACKMQIDGAYQECIDKFFDFEMSTPIIFFTDYFIPTLAKCTLVALYKGAVVWIAIVLGYAF